MIRFALGLALTLHGLIHLIGFVVPWRIAEVPGFLPTTAAVWGRVELGTLGAQLLGIGWLLGALGFLAAAAGVWLGAAWAHTLMAISAAASIVLCIFGAPAASAGLVVDLALLGALGAGVLMDLVARDPAMTVADEPAAMVRKR
ncbi:hypothetical protein OV203_21895 [Nannocystis sp. ILAH1]|uniref:hypothetical protein n=1 Tax=Nannocystis sp. ILAH1 TaxID=2996789 RepID=UPI00226FAD57|nr:hypothetical protein [Nannocystis sp. ILAH1]MCY0989806.1 hypothetical protein [Nannocystis sp. ILAH1]